MDYIKVTVTILKGDCDTVCEMLSGMVSGFEIDDPSVIDDFVNSRESRWDYIEEGLYENPDRNSSVSFYLENGEIAECGTHDELMTRGGKYAQMFEIQSKYYKESEKDDKA